MRPTTTYTLVGLHFTAAEIVASLDHRLRGLGRGTH